MVSGWISEAGTRQGTALLGFAIFLLWETVHPFFPYQILAGMLAMPMHRPKPSIDAGT